MKDADLGRGRGPWTVHVSFRDDALDPSVGYGLVFASLCSSSKYAEPEADGVRPVLRTVHSAWVSKISVYRLVVCFNRLTYFPELCWPS